ARASRARAPATHHVLPPLVSRMKRAFRRPMLASVVVFGCTLAGACAVKSASASATALPADLVLEHGRIVTMDPKTPQGQAVAITGDRITAVGSDADIRKYVGSKTKVIDLHGHLAIPGFNESHGHFMELGASLAELKLMGVPSWQ